MKNIIAMVISVGCLVFLACSHENPYSTGADNLSLAPVHMEPEVAKSGGGPPQGECPDIYYESTKTLKNGAIVTWTSSFGGFDYGLGDDYTVTVTWSVEGGSATFEDFVAKRNVWTPKKDVDGTWSTGNQSSGSIDLTVNMESMHRAVEPDWEGYIANGHFKLRLDVDGVMANLGVNVHLEDPDSGYDDRCPE